MTAKRIGRRDRVCGGFYAIQIDDLGKRTVAAGFQSAAAVASYLAGLIPWINSAVFAATWVANAPSGGERFEIGQV